MANLLDFMAHKNAVRQLNLTNCHRAAKTLTSETINKLNCLTFSRKELAEQDSSTRTRSQRH